MKRFLFGFVVLFGFSSVYGQNCNDVVLDQAKVIANPSVVTSAASALINIGADVHVVTVQNMGRYGSHLADVETFLEHKCSNWLASAGVRKANLFVLMVAPNEVKKNVFFGGAYRGALGDADTIATIYSRAANPFFATNQYDQGLAQALTNFKSKIDDYHDQRQHPNVSTTTITQQATDLKPISSIFKGFFIFLAFVGGIGLVVFIVVSLKRKQEETEQARLAANSARNKATNLFLQADASSMHYAALAETYERLSNSVTYDPSEKGQSAATYRSIERAWTDFNEAAVAATKIPETSGYTRSQMNTETPTVVGEPEPQETEEIRTPKRYVSATHRSTYVPTPVSTPPIIHHTTVFQNSPSNDLLTGILLERALEEPRETHSYHSDPEAERPSSFNSGSSRESDSDTDTSWASTNDSTPSSDTTSSNDTSWSDSGSGSGSDSGSGTDTGW
jgi:uncharacterized membrane protein YgcG